MLEILNSERHRRVSSTLHKCKVEYSLLNLTKQGAIMRYVAAVILGVFLAQRHKAHIETLQYGKYLGVFVGGGTLSFVDSIALRSNMKSYLKSLIFAIIIDIFVYFMEIGKSKRRD